MPKNKNKVKENNKRLIKIKTNQILTGTIMKLYKLSSSKVCKRKIKILLLKLMANRHKLFQAHILQKVCRKKLYQPQRKNKSCNSVIFVVIIFLLQK